MSEQRYGALADRYARKYGVPPKLFRALITAESNWNPNAVSPANARGLTQVVPRWHPNANLSTPQGQLEYGAKHIGSLIKKYGNLKDALSVYNSGRPWSQGQNISETAAYVPKILSMYGGGGSPQSGGAAPADAGGVPPALPASPLGGLDVKRLRMLLRNQTQRSLRGIMPAEGFRGELMKLAQGAIPRAGTTATAQNVGTAATTAGQALPGGFDPSPGGGWGGAEAPAKRIAQISGLPVTSEKRSRQRTASGGVSDHWTGSTQSYAVDLGTSGAAGDAAFRKIVTALGRPDLRPGQWHNLNIGGYRYQIGWRTAGHYDHIHVGVKKL
jgi:hypothetical protein